MATPKGCVLITGCSSGIGRALVEEFVRRGRRVVATARRIKSIADLEGPLCRLAPLDVTDDAQIQAAVSLAEQSSNGLGFVINNAGWGLMGPTAELDPEDLRRQFEINVIGAAAVCRAAVPLMTRRQSGVIANVGSISGETTTPFAGGYCASKAALHSLTDALRMELRLLGIRVVSIQPGAIASRFGDTASDGLERYADDESLYRAFADTIQRRAKISQQDAMPAERFAAAVVDRLLRPEPPAVIRVGPHSTTLPLIGRLPTWLRDRILARKFGL
jgi:NAD(P)-dependent dehydrogenase (short-subunit alcohol dehydrogenase family)